MDRSDRSLWHAVDEWANQPECEDDAPEVAEGCQWCGGTGEYTTGRYFDGTIQLHTCDCLAYAEAKADAERMDTVARLCREKP